MFIPISTSAAVKEKLVNENYLLQEAWNRGIIDRTLSDPPSTPSSDGLYIPTATATGAWEGKEDKLMWWNSDGYWRAVSPTDGIKVFSQQDGEIAVEYQEAEGWNAIAFAGTSTDGSLSNDSSAGNTSEFGN